MSGNLFLFLYLVIFWSGCSTQPQEKSNKLYHVEIKRMQFHPAELLLNKNDTVVFINNDIVEHNVTEESNKSWTSSSLAIGRSWMMIVSESSNYYCTLHPVMKGKLIIQTE